MIDGYGYWTIDAKYCDIAWHILPCRWDMRVARGVVQSSDDAAGSPQGLGYADGKDYSRGTNFTCMSTSGEGAAFMHAWCIVFICIGFTALGLSKCAYARQIAFTIAPVHSPCTHARYGL